MGRLVLLPLALALAMILSGCQSVQFLLADMFGGTASGGGSSSQGSVLSKTPGGQGHVSLHQAAGGGLPARHKPQRLAAYRGGGNQSGGKK